jgi:hypothetical protein
MSKAVFDNVSGFYWASSEELVTSDDPRAIAVEVPNDVAAWRLRYDVASKQLVVLYPGMTDAEAEVEAQAKLQATTNSDAA